MRFLREELALKVLSLGLAVGVWLYVRGEERPVQILTVPLELQNLPSDLAIAGEVIESVNVRVRAPEVVLKALSPERFLARVDLGSLTAGDQLVTIRADAMRIPPGVEVVRVSPEQVPLRLEKKARRELPVKARVAGEPAAGFVLGEVGVDPRSATVEGPESAVREAREVLSDIVRVDGQGEPLDSIVGLTPDRSGVRVVGGASALVSVDIHERHVTRVLPDVNVIALGASFPVKLSPRSVEVTLEGPPGVLSDIGEDDVSVVVDVAPLATRAGEYRLTPRVVFESEELSRRVLVRKVSVEEVAVRVFTGRGR